MCTAAVSNTKISRQSDQSAIHLLNQLGCSHLALAITSSCRQACHYNARVCRMSRQPMERTDKNYSSRLTNGRGASELVGSFMHNFKKGDENMFSIPP